MLLVTAAVTVLLAGCGGSQSEDQGSSQAGERPEGSSQQQPVGGTNSKPLNSGCLYDHGNESRSFGGFKYSPNGRRIVFVSSYGYDSDSSSGPSSAPGTSRAEADNEICVVNADGTRMIRLTDNSTDEYSVVWSPDGEKIAFVRHDDEYGATDPIVVMNADGSHMVELPNTENAHWGVLNALDWSPDGKNIAYASERCGIYITHADGSGTPRNFTPDPAWQCPLSPAWSPDGKRIAFQSERDTRRNVLGDPNDIYVMDALGKGAATPWLQITDGPASDSFPAWSPDGSEIAFTRWQPTLQTSTVYTVDVDGSKETRLISGGTFKGVQTWVPNTKQIAFLGPQGIYRMNSDGSDLTLVVAGEDRIF